MESPNITNSEATLKRKRTPDDVGRSTATATPRAGNVTQINYLVKARPDRLNLIEGDAETFGEVLGMIDDYEGVLQRHESLAANLGAKLVGPLVLKSFEKLFDGPIKVIQTSYALDQSPATWLDIVTFARSNPADFNLTDVAPGVKACRFWINGGQIEISEDDYRLIISGGPERMIPTQPIAEDESAELGTLNILEARLAMLIKKADAVASRARQLNYHLKGRKTAVLNSKAAEQAGTSPKNRTFPSQPFVAINAGGSPIIPNAESVKLQQHLLEQFLSVDQRQSLPHSSRAKTSRDLGSPHSFNGRSEDARRIPHPHLSSEEGAEGHYRIMMAAKIEKLPRGDPIYPPCDRCRRLKFDCTKHLTACAACTKKHAKCSWKDIKNGELDWMPNAPPISNCQSSVENGFGNTSHQGVSGSPFHQSAPENNVGPQQIEALTSDIRPDNLSNDHATLTQIASAAAGIR